MIESNGVIHGDCLELMKDILDKKIDFVLCDPPFGITAPEWDKVLDFERFWLECNRIIKNQGVIAICASQPFTTKLISSNSNNFKYCWYWIKNQGTNFFHAKRMPIRKVEEICIFGGNRYYPQITTGHIPTQSARGCSNGKAYHGDNKRDYVGGSTERYPVNILQCCCKRKPRTYLLPLGRG